MKVDWKTVRVQDIVEFNPKEKIIRGKCIKKVTMDKVHANTRDLVEYEISEFDEGVKFKNGDTLMARITPSLENGKIVLVNILEENEVGVGSSEFIVIRPKSGVSDKYFIYYLTRSPAVRNAAIKSMAGSTGRQRVQLDVLKNLMIAVPSVENQKRIGAVLKYMDDKIRLNMKMIENLFETAEMLYQSFFVSFHPFRQNGMEDSAAGPIPCGWEVKDFEELADIQTGFAFKSDEYTEKGCRVVRTTNIKYGYVQNDGLIHLPAEYYDMPQFEKYRFSCFDTVLVMIGSNVGKIGLITERNLPALENQNMWRFRAFPDVSPVFVHFQTRKINGEVRGCSSGSARDFYRKDLFKKAKCVCPPPEVFCKFDALSMPLFSQISLYLAENEKLAKIRDTLIPKLITGELVLENEMLEK